MGLICRYFQFTNNNETSIEKLFTSDVQGRHFKQSLLIRIPEKHYLDKKEQKKRETSTIKLIIRGKLKHNTRYKKIVQRSKKEEDIHSSEKNK